MTAPVRLAMVFEEPNSEGPCVLLKNGREVLRGPGRLVCASMRQHGLSVGDEYLIRTPTADVRMRFLSREERAAGASPVLDRKPKRAEQQQQEATA